MGSIVDQTELPFIILCFILAIFIWDVYLINIRLFSRNVAILYVVWFDRLLNLYVFIIQVTQVIICFVGTLVEIVFLNSFRLRYLWQIASQLRILPRLIIVLNVSAYRVSSTLSLNLIFLNRTIPRRIHNIIFDKIIFCVNL